MDNLPKQELPKVKANRPTQIGNPNLQVFVAIFLAVCLFFVIGGIAFFFLGVATPIYPVDNMEVSVEADYVEAESVADIEDVAEIKKELAELDDVSRKQIFSEQFWFGEYVLRYPEGWNYQAIGLISDPGQEFRFYDDFGDEAFALLCPPEERDRTDWLGKRSSSEVFERDGGRYVKNVEYLNGVNDNAVTALQILVGPTDVEGALVSEGDDTLRVCELYAEDVDYYLDTYYRIFASIQ